MSARIHRLRAEISADLRAFEHQVEKLGAIELTTTPDEGALARAAIALHHGYCALESTFVRIVRELGEGEPAGPDWHQTILDDMGLEIPEVRPAVLTAPTVQALRELLAFRHFFRHAYAVDLDGKRLADLQSTAIAVASGLREDVERFDAFLAALAAPPS